MVSNAPIQPHAEVFNTYGETLTNAQLLTQYGFTLDANENDCITWDLSEVYQLLAGRISENDHRLEQLSSVWNDVLPKAVQDRMFESVDSELIYFHSEGANREFCLNGDGKISHQLWVLLALLFCLRGNRDGDPTSILKRLKILLAYQLVLESGPGTSSDEIEAIPGDNADVTIVVASADLAQSVMDLCLCRKNELAREEGINLATHGDISDMLDVSLHRRDQGTLCTDSRLGSTSGDGSDQISNIRRYDRTVNSGQLYLFLDGYTNYRNAVLPLRCWKTLGRSNHGDDDNWHVPGCGRRSCSQISKFVSTVIGLRSSSPLSL